MSSDPDPRDLVRQFHTPPGDPIPDCLDDDTIAALAEGQLAPADRTSVLEHLATCARCRATVTSVARALADPSVAREISGAGSPLRWLRVAVPLAAAALLLVVVKPWRGDEGPAGHRAPPPTTAAPQPLGPIGVVAEARRLWWSSVPGVDRYRVTVSDATGRLLYETQGGDTNVVLPDSITFVAGQSYMWLVEARTGFDRWSTSRLAEFSIAGAAKP